MKNYIRICVKGVNINRLYKTLKKNDIEMFDVAGISVAMKNSHPDLFKYATHITDSYNNQGVLKFLKQYFDK